MGTHPEPVTLPAYLAEAAANPVAGNPKHDDGHPHLIAGEFQSDKYPWCKRGFVPLKVMDKTAQPFLWGYAGVRAAVDAAFEIDLKQALRTVGYVSPVVGNAEAEAIRSRHERVAAGWNSGLPDGGMMVYAHQAHEDRATLLRIVDSLSAEVAERDEAINGAVIATIETAAHLLRTHADKAISRAWDEHLRWAATQVETLKSALAALPVPAAEGK